MSEHSDLPVTVRCSPRAGEQLTRRAIPRGLPSRQCTSVCLKRFQARIGAEHAPLRYLKPVQAPERDESGMRAHDGIVRR